MFLSIYIYGCYKEFYWVMLLLCINKSTDEYIYSLREILNGCKNYKLWLSGKHNDEINIKGVCMAFNQLLEQKKHKIIIKKQIGH
ncbi:hypothetical protein BCF58_2086 [Chryseobacterium defluvii]|uniref:Uncharacterized protein n=1 Tax=Chryseobacterium defluvii TaxID=160396 RepID=A0A495SEI5_9FLAO|nr:hypothetical protein BCF58_2086 [Chryseobacterium defluvii]